MISRRNAILLAITGLIGAAGPVLAATKNSTLVGQFDIDHDGTVDLAEAKKAAGDLFDKLDANHDGKLTIKELHGRLRHRDLAAAADHGKVVTKDEYLAVVERRFKAADKDHDGKLSSWEFHTRAGRALVRLLR